METQPSSDDKQEKQEKIVENEIEEEMKSSYLDYAMSVIVGRALPDVRDGLKPVHRRILFAMNEMSMFHNKPFKKSARIVGDVLAKYHPHGDSAVYDTMVRMAQGFSLRYPLIDGQGNWGSIDGDSAAAYRYTEARLSKISEELLIDLDKNTVNFTPNFDASLKEPTVLPAKLPNLLINGSSGIAVGMATNIPPHNLNEVISATIAQIDNPEITIQELMQHIKGPDFPTAGIISGINGIKNAYKTGRGKITVKAKTNIEETKKKNKIIITEIPYMVNKSLLIQQIASLVRNKVIKGISNLRDESDREGMRVVIELKQDANTDVILNQLYKHTKMKVTFGVIMLALVNNEPKIMSLKVIIQHYIDHRKVVVRRRTQFELDKALKRAHILEGLIIALNNIDDAIKLIKQSKEVKIARNSLMEKYSLSEIQAQAILEMRLQKLTSLEQEKIITEHSELLKLIQELKTILADEQKILNIIKAELSELKEKYGDERRTQIIEREEQNIEVEDLIEEQEMVITVSHQGYIKRIPIDTYRKQRRGGKGIIAATTKDEDFVEHLFTASTHSYLLLFTNKGDIHWLKVFNIPEAGRHSKGKPIVNLIVLDKDEKVTAMVPVREFDDQHYLLMATKKGIVKKTALSEFSNPRKGGIRAITLSSEDHLIDVVLTDGTAQIILATQNGMAVRFREQDARAIGRSGKGVKGISLKKEDEVIAMVVAHDEESLLSVTENGFGKRSLVKDYRLITRGGVGVINIKTNERNGKVVSILSVTDHDEIMLMSQNGIAIRMPTKDISVIGRNTLGVRVMKLTGSDKLVAAANIINEEG